jgi:hypothetical protein
MKFRETPIITKFGHIIGNIYIGHNPFFGEKHKLKILRQSVGLKNIIGRRDFKHCEDNCEWTEIVSSESNEEYYAVGSKHWFHNNYIKLL